MPSVFSGSSHGGSGRGVSGPAEFGGHEVPRAGPLRADFGPTDAKLIAEHRNFGPNVQPHLLSLSSLVSHVGLFSIHLLSPEGRNP
ncbi:hypothetical protein Cob_v005018 [Colletotrichum orbiculare MAFF 240422]|uniref:Uncharacterized protein n=1 Tax=Colletotrichum orbiculare (strain 104-T / ATCC 96160 / CBS 514.97 / LARS 414 / MAFF 240422) TaxID=1213857 RepID=A0A484FWQ0_COLOR|nr:hypothetical protein Cob_v005018 [Colletotrichum orbiculare MAFF 240422]